MTSPEGVRRGEGAGARTGSALAGDAGSKRRRGDPRHLIDVRWSLIRKPSSKKASERGFKPILL